RRKVSLLTTAREYPSLPYPSIAAILNYRYPSISIPARKAQEHCRPRPRSIIAPMISVCVNGRNCNLKCPMKSRLREKIILPFPQRLTADTILGILATRPLMNVLFIGATGLVGSHTVPLLRDKFALTLTGIQEDELAGMPVRKLDI